VTVRPHAEQHQIQGPGHTGQRGGTFGPTQLGIWRLVLQRHEMDGGGPSLQQGLAEHPLIAIQRIGVHPALVGQCGVNL